MPSRQIRAVYDEQTITVYQAYSALIALPAVAAQSFVPPFKTDRMTWIKPSFLWMMYRSGWAAKPGQEHILAIRMTRSGFEKALSTASLSHYDQDVDSSYDECHSRMKSSPVRVQWDPERDFGHRPLPWRSLQVGLSGPAVNRYVHEWIVDIHDITGQAKALQQTGNADLMPNEKPYPLPDDIAIAIGAERG